MSEMCWCRGVPGHLIDTEKGGVVAVSKFHAYSGREKTEPEDQPMPIVNNQPYVHDLVAQDIAARGELGKRRYGTKLQPFNGRNALQDAYEEVIDAAVYLKQAMMEAEG